MGKRGLTPPSQPRRLGDRYELLEPIGDGGMGRVFRAHDCVLDREVAVKLLDRRAPDGAASASATEHQGRVDEARLAARLAHPGIAHVFDVGIQEDDTSYVVMELVEGRPLRELMRRRGAWPVREAIDLVEQVADALDDAHRHGVVHCDVKPENIIVTPDGRTKLVDFGIARASVIRQNEPMDEILGSVAYLAPEQVRGEGVDRRTDVYALGVVLYEMLTGRPAFRGPDAQTIATRRLVSDPPAPRSLNAHIPVDLQTVMLRALARDPAARFASAGEMRDALAAVASRPVTRLRVVPAPPARVAFAAAVAILLLGVVVARIGLGGAPGRGVVAPKLVGHQLAELPGVLKQAGFAPGDVSVITRPVEQSYVGKVVDQQPQPGQALEPNTGIEVAVGVPQRSP